MSWSGPVPACACGCKSQENKRGGNHPAQGSMRFLSALTCCPCPCLFRGEYLSVRPSTGMCHGLGPSLSGLVASKCKTISATKGSSHLGSPGQPWLWDPHLPDTQETLIPWCHGPPSGSCQLWQSHHTSGLVPRAAVICDCLTQCWCPCTNEEVSGSVAEEGSTPGCNAPGIA